MEQLFLIPLTNVQQRFTIEMAGVSYIIVCKWNGEMPAWTIDVLSEVTSLPIIVNLPLVAGSDLLQQFNHVGIPGKLLVYTDGNEFAPPTLANLGQEANLYYLVDL